MIFVTVGTQLPFDRLIKVVDSIKPEINDRVIAQIGNSALEPSNIEWKKFYTPDEMDKYFSKAQMIISHAGMGSIINCLRLKKPIVTFPRLHAFGEHRNDHQLDTVKSFTGVKGVYPAKDENELIRLIHNAHQLDAPDGLECPERQQLCEFIISLAS